MKKKINIQFIIITIVAIITTVSLSTLVFYKLFKKEVMESIKTNCELIIDSDSEHIISQPDNIRENAFGDCINELRITLIAADGTAVYDSDVATSAMENHKERPEVIAAINNGYGEAVRKSHTIDKNSFYYAKRLDNGYVLRVSKEAGSITSVFLSVIPIIGFICIILFIICIMLSHFLTKSIIQPIEDMADNLDSSENINVYKELNPFVDTIRKQHADIMRNANMRQEFTANVSHELKTPIALIQGYAEGLKEGVNEDAESREFYCEVIMDEASKMNQMVKNLLTLNQLEFGDEDIVFDRFNLTALVRGVLQSMEIMADQAGAKIFLHTEEDIYAWADQFKVEQVVKNYVSNACHHVSGDMVIEVKMVQKDGKVRVSVFNTGTPIPEADIVHIWDKFYKVDKAHTREYGGNGIGLSIVKAIMKSFHQEYGVKNYDNGVEFWFELDVQ